MTECPNCFVIVDTTQKTLQVYKGIEPQQIPEDVKTGCGRRSNAKWQRAKQRKAEPRPQPPHARRFSPGIPSHKTNSDLHCSPLSAEIPANLAASRNARTASRAASSASIRNLDGFVLSADSTESPGPAARPAYRSSASA